MSGNDGTISQLERQYCPPLDNATLLAIVSDYDLSKSADLQAACQILDIVAEGANSEDTSAFDPSGSSGGIPNSDDGHHDGSNSLPGWSSVTDDTSLSQGISALDLEGLDFSEAHPGSEEEGYSSIGKDYSSNLEGLDFASKEAVLRETFPGLKPFDINWTLSKCKGNAALAIDELLHQVFLEESGSRHRGIDAFSESDTPTRPRKAKGRKKRIIMSDEIGSNSLSRSESPSEVSSSKWDNARKDIEFISLHAEIPMQQVTSIYHKNGASVPATITAIIVAHSKLNLGSDDATIDLQAHELAREFPTIGIEKLLALVELTHPSTTSAHALAEALTMRPNTSGSRTPIQLEFRLPPPDPAESSNLLMRPKPESHNAIFAPEYKNPDSVDSALDSKDYIIRRNAAFNQATAAYRKGKSDHLMGGAAAYYSSLGRDFDSRAKSAVSASADALVKSQSRPGELDLHGVTVKDAERIARDGVTSWWVNTRGQMHTGFRIITGKGTHSEGGKGKLGPAVGKMLMREGWKVEIGSGFLVVTGVVGKR